MLISSQISIINLSFPFPTCFTSWKLGSCASKYTVKLVKYNNKFKMSCVCAQLCPILCDPMDCSCQVSLSMGFPRQECWRGLPFPSPGDLPDPGIEPEIPALQADPLPSEPAVKPYKRTRKSSSLILLHVAVQFSKQRVHALFELWVSLYIYLGVEL